jgi:hypothetical protein
LISQVLDAHTDLAGLRAAHPEVAEEFVRLRGELDRPVQPDGVSSSSDAERRKAAEELALQAVRIRSLRLLRDQRVSPNTIASYQRADHQPGRSSPNSTRR